MASTHAPGGDAAVGPKGHGDGDVGLDQSPALGGHDLVLGAGEVIASGPSGSARWQRRLVRELLAGELLAKDGPSLRGRGIFCGIDGWALAALGLAGAAVAAW